MIHTTGAKFSADFKFSASGLGLLNDRPTKVQRVTLQFVCDSGSATISVGIYSPIHSEAVSWSRAILVGTLPRSLTVRAPKNTDWGHYAPDDIVVIGTFAGTAKEVRCQCTAHVSYGRSAKLVADYSMFSEVQYEIPLAMASMSLSQ